MFATDPNSPRVYEVGEASRPESRFVTTQGGNPERTPTIRTNHSLPYGRFFRMSDRGPAESTIGSDIRLDDNYEDLAD